MIYQVRLFRGLRALGAMLHQLEQAETVYGLKNRVLLLFLSSLLIFAVSGWFGLGAHEISAEINNLSNSQFEWEKFLFWIGRLIAGLLFAAIYLYLMSLWFDIWTESSFKSLLVVQAFAFLPILIEKILHILFLVLLGLDWYSTPFSLGAIAQSAHAPAWIIYFLGCASLFKIWSMYIQFIGLRKLAGMSRGAALLLTLSIHLIFWAITATLAFFELKPFF
ncbi:hypothetical protein [Falsibacillus pallidus]|uniref:hypothetical protein n=1 Tax=Falsibacillus pallidus TaxID=493781 RepID=UPI003D97A7F0